MARKIKPWNAIEWVEWEVESMRNLYDNTSLDAARFVLDLLEEDEYTDELDEQQRQLAIRAARTAVSNLTPKPAAH